MPVGRPCEYSKEDHVKIVEAFKHTIVLSNVSGQVRRDRDTIKAWLQRGKDDLKEGNYTELAQFFLDVKETISSTILALEQRLLNGDEKGWQRVAWYLERCARQDYGADAGIIEDILKEFADLKAQLGKQNG